MDEVARLWIDALAAVLGAEPLSDADADELLALAGVAAHASQRTAAPLSCYLAARSGTAPDEAHRVAEALAARFVPPARPL
jgi:hypothetical protein